MISNLQNGSLTATTQELGIPLNELPPLLASDYNSDEEQSQLLEHHYYGHVPLALANNNDNSVSQSSAKFHCGSIFNSPIKL